MTKSAQQIALSKKTFTYKILKCKWHTRYSISVALITIATTTFFVQTNDTRLHVAYAQALDSYTVRPVHAFHKIQL